MSHSPSPFPKASSASEAAPSETCDVVLVKTSPEEIVQGQWYRMPLLGLGYLAGYLREKGISVRIVDALFDRLSMEETVSRIAAASPKLVGFTAMTHEIDRAAKAARKVRLQLPKVRTVVGGPHCAALPLRTLQEYKCFDFAAVGEGERTLYELYDALFIHTSKPERKPFESIPGLAFRRGDEAKVNDRGPWIEDLDSLPLPAWDLYGRADVYQIFASRGCPYQCIFCMRVLGERVRYRSARNVVDEFEAVVERFGPKRIDFSDETFTLRREWALEICGEIIRRGLHKKVRWFANGRVDRVDEDLLRRMREAGCVRIGYGIESGNAEILKVAQKGVGIEQIEKAVATTKRAGLEMEAFYILGFPGETRETALDTIRMAARLNTTTAAFGIMVPYPGTKVAEMAANREGGYRLLSTDWSAFDKHLGNAMELETLSRRELERLQARAYLWFYLRNLRLGDLAKFVWEKRKAVWRMAEKLRRHG